jgi:hypothetical protein
MQDIRLYKPSGIYTDKKQFIEIMYGVNPDDSTARSIEVIAGKVVKYMLTVKGSDAFDPDYGSTSMHYLHMSAMFFPQFKREVYADVENCENFIKRAEQSMGTASDKLYKINVLDIVYNIKNTPDRVDVHLEILTTQGKRACVAITNRTDR